MYSDNPDSKSLPPHLILLFMATATIVDENEAVSGPVFPVQFLTKKKVSFLSLLFPLFPFFSGHYYFHLCARHQGRRKRGRDTKFEPGKWAQWRWKRKRRRRRSGESGEVFIYIAFSSYPPQFHQVHSNHQTSSNDV